MSETQASRILAVLRDGREHTLAEIHRRAGHSIVHSRISDLRAKGCVIDHRTKPRKRGAAASTYRLVSAPEAVLATASRQADAWARAEREAEQRRRDVPRDDTHRYRLYGVRDGGVLDLLGTAASPETVGRLLVNLGERGELHGVCVGLLDTHGTDTATGSWTVNPWDQA